MRRVDGLRARERRGIAVVEFAVILPLLLFLLIGIWELGRLVDAKEILSNACREGGRAASTGIRSQAEIQQVVLDYLARNNIKNSGVAISIQNITSAARSDPRTANQLDHFTITVTIPVADIRYQPFNFFNQSALLTAQGDWYSMKNIPVSVNTSIPIG